MCLYYRLPHSIMKGVLINIFPTHLWNVSYFYLPSYNMTGVFIFIFTTPWWNVSSLSYSPLDLKCICIIIFPTPCWKVSPLSSFPLYYEICLCCYLPSYIMQGVFIIIFSIPLWNGSCAFWDRSDATGGGSTYAPCHTPAAMYRHSVHSWRCVMSVAVWFNCILLLPVCVFVCFQTARDWHQ